MEDDRVADGDEQPLEVGDGLLGHALDLVAPLEDGVRRGRLFGAQRLEQWPRAWSVQSARGSTMPPVVTLPTWTIGRITMRS